MVYTREQVIENSLKYFEGDDIASDVFCKYALKNKEDYYENSPSQMFDRLSGEFSRIEDKYIKNDKTYLPKQEIRELFDGFKYIVGQGSPLSGVGNFFKYQSLSNCFLIDPPNDSYGGILLADQELVQIMKRRGGVGIDISTIRPKGMETANSANTTDGIGVFMQRFSNSCREVAQGGRRGALMITIDVKHPEIETFINIKRDLTKVTGANISIKIRDDFMKAVESDSDYELQWPVDAAPEDIKYRKVVKAKNVWSQIVDSAWSAAEPGLLFWDTVNRNSPADVYKKSVGTNPCCFAKSKETRVLTKEGIKDIKNVTSNDLIWVDDQKVWAKNSGYFNAGIADVYKVKFTNNEELYITNNHKLAKTRLKRVGTRFEYDGLDLVELKDLKVGDKINVHMNEVQDYKFGEKGTYNEGLIMGWLTGDGCLSYADEDAKYPDTILDFWKFEHDVGDRIYEIFKNMNYEITPHLFKNNKNDVKRIKTSIYTREFTNKYESNIWNFKSNDKKLNFLNDSSKEFIKGFLQSYFTADGSVNCSHASKSYFVGLSSVNKERLIQIKDILNLFGIKSHVYKFKNAGTVRFRPNEKSYSTKDIFRLNIAGRENLLKFKENIGFISNNKLDKLNDIFSSELTKKSKSKEFTEIESIEKYSTEEVGCIEVYGYHRLTVNGIISGQSEINLSPNDSCRLMVINTTSYVENPFTKDAKFNYELFEQHAYKAQLLMDDLVELEIESVDRIIEKIKHDKEPENVKKIEMDLWEKIKREAVEGRRTGLGPTGIGDTIAFLNLAYGSDASIEVVEKIYKTLEVGAYKATIDMAETRGAFPLFDFEKEKDHHFIKRVVEACGPEYVEKWKQFGRRNFGLTTTAPVGSISILTKTTSGIEPAFLLSYKRRRKIVTENEKVDYVDKMGDKWQEYIVHHHGLKKWMEVTGLTDEKLSPYYGSTSNEIDWVQSVKLQAAAQKWIDHGISKTCNLPENVSKDLVSQVYMEAWKNGCKGFTVYRDKSRDGVLVSVTEQKKETKGGNNLNAQKRPKELSCDIHRINVRNGEEVETWMVIVGLLDNKPYEIFAGLASNIEVPKKIKKGKMVKNGKKDGLSTYNLVVPFEDEQLIFKDVVNLFDNPVHGSFTRTISLAMRHEIPINFIVEQVQKDKDSNMFSFHKSLARVLKTYVPDGTKSTSNKVCDNCGSDSLVYVEGCVTCTSCSNSKCG